MLLQLVNKILKDLKSVMEKVIKKVNIKEFKSLKNTKNTSNLHNIHKEHKEDVFIPNYIELQNIDYYVPDLEDEDLILPEDDNKEFTPILNEDDFHSPEIYEEEPNYDLLEAHKPHNVENGLSNILISSNETLKNINKFISLNYKEKVFNTSTNILKYNKSNYYITEKYIYTFTDTNWDKIHEIICDTKNLAICNKLVEKTNVFIIENMNEIINTSLTKLLKQVETTSKALNFLIEKKMPNKTMSKIIQKVLSLNIFESLKNDSKFISYTNLTIDIGKAIMKYLFIEKMKETQQGSFIESIQKEKTKKNIKVTLLKFSLNITQELLYNIINNKISYNNFQDLFLNKYEATWIFNELIYNNISLLKVEDRVYYTNQMYFELQKVYIKIGSILCKVLLENEILIERKLPGKEVEVYFNEDLKIALLTNSSYYKPLLTITNKQLETEHQQNNLNFKIIPDISLIIKKNPYLSITPKDRLNKLLEINTNNNYFCINTNYFHSFINYFTEILNIKITEKTTKIEFEKIYTFLYLYKIDIYNIVDKIKKKELIELLKHALNFNSFFNEPNFKIKESKYLLHIYNKITSYKLFLKGLLQDLNIYKAFNYFIIPKSIKTFRLYSLVYYLDKGHPLTKPFILFKNNKENLNIENFEKYKKSLITVINDQEIKNKILQKSYFEYINEKKETLLNFIIDNLNTIESFNVYKKIQGSTEQLNWLIKHIKNKNKLFLTHSTLNTYLCNEQQQEKQQEKQLQETKEQIFELDATSSGFQIISMFLNCKKLGDICNISGTTKIDIYNKFVIELEETIIIMENYLKNIIKQFSLNKEFYNQDSNNNVIHKKMIKNETLTLNEYLIGFLTLFTVENSNNNLKELIKRITLENFTNKISVNFNISKILFMISDEEKQMLDKSSLINNNYLSIICLKHYIHWKKNINYNPWILNTFFSRKVSKVQLMATPYNIGINGRFKEWLNFFEAYALDNFEEVHDGGLEFTINMLEKYYKSFVTSNLKTCKTFLSMIKKIDQYVTYETPFIEATHCIYFYEEYRLLTKIIKGSYVHKVRILKPTQNLDIENLHNQLPSLICHMVDSTIVAFYLEKILNLNMNSSIKTSIDTIHDCYFINFDASVFLKDIIKDCYIDFWKLNLLQEVLQNIKNKDIKKNILKDLAIIRKYYPDFKIENPNFLK